MISRALDSNNDLIIESGQIKTVSGAAETVQHVRTRLLFYLNEWFLDLNAGTPYFQKIFTKPANLANIESELKLRILRTFNVTRLNEFSMTYEGANTRRLIVSFSAETSDGPIDVNEVTINV